MFDIIRIAWRSKIESPDFTESYAILFMFSLLEPELGIFLACLPLCQPVSRALVNSRIVTWLRRTLLADSGTARSRATSASTRQGLPVSKQDTFKRLPGDDESNKGLRYEAHIMADLEHVDTQDNNSEEAGTIHVKSSWNADSRERTSVR